MIKKQENYLEKQQILIFEWSDTNWKEMKGLKL
jgi:hypothetical protein